MGDTDAVTAKVNGKDAEFVKERKSGKFYAYYVVYTFDKTSDILLGDINSDGTVSVNDVTTGQQYLANSITLTEAQIKAADMDGNGIINVNDITALQIFIASNG